MILNTIARKIEYTAPRTAKIMNRSLLHFFFTFVILYMFLCEIIFSSIMRSTFEGFESRLFTSQVISQRLLRTAKSVSNKWWPTLPDIYTTAFRLRTPINTHHHLNSFWAWSPNHGRERAPVSTKMQWLETWFSTLADFHAAMKMNCTIV